MSTKINCKLCLNREADKKNSHIIPKFLSKRLFESTRPRHSIEINEKGKTKKIQDIPKEDFLLCKFCEKRFEHLETYIAKKITAINNYNNLKDQFGVVYYSNNKVLKCLKTNPVLFKTFVYSMIWRCSISTLEEFKNFQLDSITESKLRDFLDITVKDSHHGLIESMASTENILDFDYCVFKPIVRNEFSRGIFTSYKMDKYQFGIFTGEFIFFFFSNSNSINPAFKLISNYQNEILLINLVEINDWKKLNESVVNKLF